MIASRGCILQQSKHQVGVYRTLQYSIEIEMQKITMNFDFFFLPYMYEFVLQTFFIHNNNL